MTTPPESPEPQTPPNVVVRTWWTVRDTVREIHTDESGKISHGRVNTTLGKLVGLLLALWGVHIYLNDPKALPLLTGFLLPLICVSWGVSLGGGVATQWSSGRVKAARHLPPSPSASTHTDGGK